MYFNHILTIALTWNSLMIYQQTQNFQKPFPFLPRITQKWPIHCSSTSTQWTVNHHTSSIPYKTPLLLYSYFWAGLDMHSIFCCLGSWGWVNEAPLGLFHVKSSSDSADIVLFLKASPIVNRHPITQLGRHADARYIGWQTGRHTNTHTSQDTHTLNILF